MLLTKINLFLQMNGYGFYIWSSYLIWLIFLFLIIIKVILRKKNIEKKISYLKAGKIKNGYD